LGANAVEAVPQALIRRANGKAPAPAKAKGKGK